MMRYARKQVITRCHKNDNYLCKFWWNWLIVRFLAHFIGLKKSRVKESAGLIVRIQQAGLLLKILRYINVNKILIFFFILLIYQWYALEAINWHKEEKIFDWVGEDRLNRLQPSPNKFQYIHNSSWKIWKKKYLGEKVESFMFSIA